MRVLNVRNVHQALSEGLYVLDKFGIYRESRGGPVYLYPGPVATVYQKPLERVVFWPQRDANPFFHLYESLWLLAGRNDVKPLVKFIGGFKDFSDDGIILHGAYGYRWRNAFMLDQLQIIAESLKANQDDRQNVLQMWDTRADLGQKTKDKPCNLTVTFQRGHRDGELNMTVFCRSNDILWGAYGANAVHFAFLQEYLATWIGCPVGEYTQISVNWHGYLKTLEQVKSLPRTSFENPYQYHQVNGIYREVKPLLMPDSIEEVNSGIEAILNDIDRNYEGEGIVTNHRDGKWAGTIRALLYAHHLWKTREGAERFREPSKIIADLDPLIDFVAAAAQWLDRRFWAWDTRQSSQAWHESAERGAKGEVQ